MLTYNLISSERIGSLPIYLYPRRVPGLYYRWVPVVGFADQLDIFVSLGFSALFQVLLLQLFCCLGVPGRLIGGRPIASRSAPIPTSTA